MSEPTLAAVEAAAGPLIADAEKALAPEAQKVLTDLHAFVAGEADKLRQELPGLVEAGVQHLHALGSSILGRYQAVMEHIDAHLTGTVTPAVPTPPAAGSAAVTPSTSSDTPAASSDPTQAATPQATDTTTSVTPSEPSSTDSASAPSTETPGA